MPESMNDRPTKAHEYIFLLSKSQSYFYDAEAIREPNAGKLPYGDKHNFKLNNDGAQGKHGKTSLFTGGTKQEFIEKYYTNGHNKRSVWTVSTQGFPEAHFAVFPQQLIIPCIKAGCPTTVCAKCGAPYKRIVEKAPATSTLCPKTQAAHEARGGTGTVTGTVGKSGGGRVEGYTKTLGFEPTCECNADIAHGTVLDPFVGSGTTCLTAKQLGRNSIGIDKNDKYLQMAKRRINSI
jgi:hypothetical protein